MLTMGITALRSIGATTSTLLYLPWLALAYAQLGKSDEAWRCISEALTLIEQSDQRITEAEVHRVAGEIVLASVLPDEKKAEETSPMPSPSPVNSKPNPGNCAPP